MYGYNISQRGAIPEPYEWVAFMALRVMTRKEYEALHFVDATPALLIGADGNSVEVLGNRISGRTLDDIVEVVAENAKNQSSALRTKPS